MAILVTLPPSIRENAIRCPDSSTAAMHIGTPICAAFLSHPSRMIRASAKDNRLTVIMIRLRCWGMSPLIRRLASPSLPAGRVRLPKRRVVPGEAGDGLAEGQRHRRALSQEADLSEQLPDQRVIAGGDGRVG